MKIAIICNDTFGHRMAGPAIRSLELALALSSAHDVWLVGDLNLDEIELPVPRLSATQENIRTTSITADVVIVQGDALKRFPALKSARGALVADLYCPTQLEYFVSSDSVHELSRTNTALGIAETLSEQLYIADHFLCASQRQLHFWLGAFSLTGRLDGSVGMRALEYSMHEAFSLIPFGVSNQPPPADQKRLRERFNLKQDDFVLIWGGGIYDWFDVGTIIKAIAQLSQLGLPVHLVFMGVKHPNPNIAEHDIVREAVKLARELDVLDAHVHFNFGWIDYKERHTYLLDADAGVSAHLNNLETVFSFRTRMLDYLWCGLPIIATRGDEFGDSLESRQAGIAVDFQDVQGWKGAIERLMADRSLRRLFSENAIKWSKDLRWSTLTSDFSKKCHSIKASPKRQTWIRRWNNQNSSKSSSLLNRARNLYHREGLLGAFRRIAQKLRR